MAVAKSTSTRAGSRRSPAPVTEAAAAAAWTIEGPSGDVWTARPWVHPSERAEKGKAVRKQVPRASHATLETAKNRDPIAILEQQETTRLQHLLPLRHQRMAESAFAYYRGAAIEAGRIAVPLPTAAPSR
jgi:hypothetical protein